LKGVGQPEFYSGSDVELEEKSGCWKMSARTYIETVTNTIEILLDVKLKNYGSPMEVGDHPEQDETDILYGKDVSIYQMLVGSAHWAVGLGRFDIQYATNTLAWYASMPRAGHLKRTLCLFGYLKQSQIVV